MLNRIPRAPIAAALLAMLAACGGGDGNDTATSSSPRTQPGTPTPATSTPTQGQHGAADSNPMVTPALPGNSAGAPTTTSPLTPPTQGNGSTATPIAATGNLVLDTRTSAPISSNGIRGDVLLTGLSQLGCSGPLSPVSSLDGPRSAGADEQALPVIGAGTELTPSNYVLRPDAAGIATPLAGLCQRMNYRPPVDGRVYELNVFSNPIYRYSPSATLGFHYLDAELQLAVTTEAFALSAIADVDDTEDRGPAFQGQERAEQELHLSAGGVMTVNRDALVPFDTRRIWGNGQHGIELLVLPADAANRFRLCWSADLQYARRLQCTIWGVPANWRYGAELQFVDQYLVDDRSSHAGEAEGSVRYFRADAR